MFGVAGNEVIVVTSSATSHDLRGGVAQAVSAWNSVEIADEHLIAPTRRPSGTSRLTREGLYVFRYFEMLRSDVDDFIRLSEQGWLSFEHADEFETEPEGLFIREDPEPERAAMLPVTWYDGLASVAALAPVPGRRTSSLPGARRAHVADHRLRHASAAPVALRRSVR